MRRRAATWRLALLLLGCGCQLIPLRASRERRNRIAQADALVLHDKSRRFSARLTNREVISQFSDLYRCLKWVDYWHTVPAGLDRRTIDVLCGETQLTRLSLFGQLWEGSQSDLKTAELSPEQTEWLDGLFGRLAYQATDSP